jgi:hypothetical protein
LPVIAQCHLPTIIDDPEINNVREKNDKVSLCKEKEVDYVIKKTKDFS